MMDVFRSTAARYALVIVCAAAIAGGAYAVDEVVLARQAVPESVMGPGYNPPPPFIPVS